MTQIEREVYQKVIFSLVRQDREGNLYISIDEYNALFIPEKNKEEFAQMLVDNEVELKEVKDRKVKKDDTVTESFENGERQELMDSYNAITFYEDELAQKLGRYPTTEEVAKEMGASTKAVDSIKEKVELYNNFIHHEELSEVIGTDANATIVGQEEYEDDAYAELYRKEIKELVLDALEGFNPELIEMFKYHYGLEDGVYHTFSETARKFSLSTGVTISRIRVMNARARIVLGEIFGSDKKAIEFIHDMDLTSQRKRI